MSDGGPIRVLLVEDNPGDRRLVEEYLGGSVALRSAASLVGALERLSDENFDLLLLDMSLSDANRLEGFHALQKRAPELPIVLLSGVGDPAAVQEALRAGAQDFVPKSQLDGELLVRTVRHTLDRRAAIAEREQMQEELQQTSRLRAIGELAAGIAHEINTPMQYVSDNTEFLQQSFESFQKLLEAQTRALELCEGKPLPEDVRDELDRLSEEIEVSYLCEEVPRAFRESREGIGRVTGIVRAMKELSHPGGSRGELDLNHAVETALTISRGEWKLVAETETDLDPELPSVPCFVSDLHQALINIIVNAAHSITDAQQNGSLGKIMIRTRRDGDWAEIRIADSGGGIPAAVQPRIFEPFFTTKDVGRGTGQGLAQAHSAMDRHGGSLTFETELGRGTTFFLRLPLEVPSEG